MSIYPKRIIPGESVFVHVRVKSPMLGRPLVCIHLEDPRGDRRLIKEFKPIIFPIRTETANNAVSDELRRVEPVYLSARHMVGNNGSIDAMLEGLRKMLTSVHFHFHHPMPSNCIPGRYMIHIEMRIGGQVFSSDTAKDAYFFVDSLRLKTSKLTKYGGKSVVVNEGPLAVPAIVAGVDYNEMSTDKVMLDPGHNEIEFNGKLGFLRYSEDRHTIRLSSSDAPFCVRDESLAWSICSKTRNILIFGRESSTPGWELSGKCKEIWIAASGLVLRDEIRSPENADSYDEMLAQGLLLETSDVSSH